MKPEVKDLINLSYRLSEVYAELRLVPGGIGYIIDEVSYINSELCKTIDKLDEVLK